MYKVRGKTSISVEGRVDFFLLTMLYTDLSKFELTFKSHREIKYDHNDSDYSHGH